ncbi:MAG: transporter substrate-binding domain-containing protein, partial [Tumebacillaceae bacterium]
MNKTMKSMLLVGTMIVGMGLVTAGCGKTDTATTNGGGADQKVYKVGTDATYAPFESQVGDKIQGFDIDVLDAVAKAENIKLQYINTNWDGIFLALNNKERDIVASAVSITDERKKTLDFSDPYFDATQMIVFKKGGGFKSLNDLKGKKIAVQNGTTGDTVVSDMLGKGSPNIKRFENMPLALMELKNGGVDAAV